MISDSVKQQKVSPSLSRQSDPEEVENEVKSQATFPAISVTIPQYLNLEPSLAMDWVEISWDELHIKERVGAGISFALFFFPRYFCRKNLVIDLVIISFPKFNHAILYFFPFRIIWDGASCGMAWIG